MVLPGCSSTFTHNIYDSYDVIYLSESSTSLKYTHIKESFLKGEKMENGNLYQVG